MSESIAPIRLAVILFTAAGLVAGAKAGVISIPDSPKVSSEVKKPTKQRSGDGAKILAEARKYDSERYVMGGGHPPGSYRPGKGLDCSGLINVAVMNVTGIKEDRLAQNFRSSKHWKRINIADAKEGDIVYRLKRPGEAFDHVAIVVRNKGNGRIDVFEARTKDDVRSEQIRLSPNQPYGRWTGALRFHR